jgi:hypothetical protein
MINFRFHLASLVAIFLALALGVVIGAGVIDRGVVNALDSRLNRVEARSDQIQGENDALRSAAGEQEAAIKAIGTQAVDGRLTNADVGVIAVRGVSGDRVTATVDSLQDGGALATGVLWLESPWKLDNDRQITALAQAIGSSSRRATVLREQAWQQMARRMAAPRPASSSGQSSTTGATDVLVALRDAGFVSFEQVDGKGSIEEFAGVAPVFVLVVGNRADVPAGDVVMPAATAITAAELPLVVGDVYTADATPSSSRGDDVAALRDSGLSKTVSTVNDLDRPQGPVTMSLAVADLLRIPPVVGHYGIGADTVVLPPPVAS